MSNPASTLSLNIRHLRKEQKISQEELAAKIGIKRSNIAAYESKNVEPRLRIILKMAEYFDISIKDLVKSDIYNEAAYESFSQPQSIAATSDEIELTLDDNKEINTFIEKSIKIKQILDGFKAFYQFKRKNLNQDDHEKQKLIYDIDNFIELMEHLMSYNETVISAITKVRNTSS